MKSTAGARHLAESANWLAWQVGRECPGLLGSLMETALGHWTRDRFADFLAWRRRLPC
jgi:hypothetical protein